MSASISTSVTASVTERTRVAVTVEGAAARRTAEPPLLAVLAALLVLLAALGGALASPATAATTATYGPRAVAAAAPCTSPDPAVCLIREMTPEEREKAREVRIRYHGLLDQMKEVEAEMRARCQSDEEIARVVVRMRNEAKDITRAGMSPEAIEALEQRNIEKYGNPLGPTADQLFAKYGSWAAVIEAAGRSNPAVDRELGLEPHSS
ncbi:hypothetical protein [Streptomyces apocyni]|uniref:hypothetical protein n=1 Tax=Streptomyces apocyni TaxID=2654677 RepID=UPI001E5BC25B|nr:hypothetical protein [Streptomyces apocyni]